MSDWCGHLKFGITFQLITLLIIGVASFYLNRIPSIIELIFIAPILILSPLLPDVDHQSSKITLFFLLIGVLSLWAVYLFAISYLIYVIVFLSIIIFVSQFVPHRGITHRWWFVLVFNVVLAITTGFFILSVVSFSGMMSHLVADKIY